MKNILFFLLLISFTSSSQRNAGIIAANKDTAFTSFTNSTTGNITASNDLLYINFLVKYLKGKGFWPKLPAAYPFVGGTAAKHSLNLRYVHSYQITWYGGVTHNANGITGNGMNGYGNTGFNDGLLSYSNHHLAIYSRSNTGENRVDMGTLAANRYVIYSLDGSTSYGVDGSAAQDSSFFGGTVPSGKQFVVLTRSANNNAAYYSNGSMLAQRFYNQGSLGMTGLNLFILAGSATVPMNNTPALFSSKNLAFASIGLSLTASEVAEYNSIIQDAQAILGRAN